MLSRAVSVAVFLVLVLPVSPFIIKLGVPASDCGSGSIQDGLQFFAWQAAKAPGSLAIVDAHHSYPIEYVIETSEANCSVEALTASIKSLADKCQFMLAGAGYAENQSYAANSSKTVLFHPGVTDDSVYDLDLPYIFGITSSPSLYLKPLLKAMLLNGMTRMAIAWNPTGDPEFVCAGALSLLTALKQLHPLTSFIDINYTTEDTSRPGFFASLAFKILDSGAQALLACDSPIASEELGVALLRSSNVRNLESVFLLNGPSQPDFLAYMGGFPYALSASQWNPRVQYGDEVFGSAATYDSEYRKQLQRAPDDDAAGASASALTLAWALRFAFSACVIKPEVVAAADVRALMWSAGAISCPDSSGQAATGNKTVDGSSSSIGNISSSSSSSITELLVRSGDGSGRLTGYDLVIRALLEGRFDTFFGPVEFSATRRNVAKSGAITQVLGGEVQVVLPLEAASAALVVPKPVPETGGLSPGVITGLVLGFTALVLLLALYGLYRRQMRRNRTLFGQVRPPGLGPATTLVVTDIEGSTTLWETLPAHIMEVAMQVHDSTVRALATTHDGYEAANEGDSFVLAFHHPYTAVVFAVKAQQKLLLADWPEPLLRHEKADVVHLALVSDGSLLAAACHASSWTAQLLTVLHSKAIHASGPASGLGKSVMGAARSMRLRLGGTSVTRRHTDCSPVGVGANSIGLSSVGGLSGRRHTTLAGEYGTVGVTSMSRISAIGGPDGGGGGGGGGRAAPVLASTIEEPMSAVITARTEAGDEVINVARAVGGGGVLGGVLMHSGLAPSWTDSSLQVAGSGADGGTSGGAAGTVVSTVVATSVPSSAGAMAAIIRRTGIEDISVRGALFGSGGGGDGSGVIVVSNSLMDVPLAAGVTRHALKDPGPPLPPPPPPQSQLPSGTPPLNMPWLLRQAITGAFSSASGNLQTSGRTTYSSQLLHLSPSPSPTSASSPTHLAAVGRFLHLHYQQLAPPSTPPLLCKLQEKQELQQMQRRAGSSSSSHLASSPPQTSTTPSHSMIVQSRCRAFTDTPHILPTPPPRRAVSQLLSPPPQHSPRASGVPLSYTPPTGPAIAITVAATRPASEPSQTSHAFGGFAPLTAGDDSVPTGGAGGSVIAGGAGSVNADGGDSVNANGGGSVNAGGGGNSGVGVAADGGVASGVRASGVIAGGDGINGVGSVIDGADAGGSCGCVGGSGGSGGAAGSGRPSNGWSPFAWPGLLRGSTGGEPRLKESTRSNRVRHVSMGNTVAETVTLSGQGLATCGGMTAVAATATLVSAAAIMPVVDVTPASAPPPTQWRDQGLAYPRPSLAHQTSMQPSLNSSLNRTRLGTGLCSLGLGAGMGGPDDLLSANDPLDGYRATGTVIGAWVTRAEGDATGAVVPGASGGSVVMKNQVLGRLLRSLFRRARPSDSPRFLVQRGLRVRMGVHSGLTDPHEITTKKASGRTLYAGAFLAIAKRTSDAAHGGQIVLTDETYRQLPARCLVHRAWLLQMGHHTLAESATYSPAAPPLREDTLASTGAAPSTAADTPDDAAADDDCDVCEYQLYCVVGYELAGRLALMPPLRTAGCLVEGVLSAPVGVLAVAFMYVHALQTLMAWDSGVAREAVELFHRVASYQCKEYDGYISEGQEGLVLATFRNPGQALLWALSSQQALVEQKWDPKLLEHELAEEVSVLVPANTGDTTQPLTTTSAVPTATTSPVVNNGGGFGAGAGGGGSDGEAGDVPPGMLRKVLLRGLRMRVGVDIGRLHESISPASCAVVYRGKAMNRAARIAMLASSSQVLCSASAWSTATSHRITNIATRVNACSLGRHILRGVSEPIEVLHCRLRQPDPEGRDSVSGHGGGSGVGRRPSSPTSRPRASPAGSATEPPNPSSPSAPAGTSPSNPPSPSTTGHTTNTLRHTSPQCPFPATGLNFDASTTAAAAVMAVRSASAAELMSASPRSPTQPRPLQPLPASTSTSFTSTDTRPDNCLDLHDDGSKQATGEGAIGTAAAVASVAASGGAVAVGGGGLSAADSVLSAVAVNTAPPSATSFFASPASALPVVSALLAAEASESAAAGAAYTANTRGRDAPSPVPPLRLTPDNNTRRSSRRRDPNSSLPGPLPSESAVIRPSGTSCTAAAVATTAATLRSGVGDNGSGAVAAVAAAVSGSASGGVSISINNTPPQQPPHQNAHPRRRSFATALRNLSGLGSDHHSGPDLRLWRPRETALSGIVTSASHTPRPTTAPDGAAGGGGCSTNGTPSFSTVRDTITLRGGLGGSSTRREGWPSALLSALRPVMSVLGSTAPGSHHQCLPQQSSVPVPQGSIHIYTPQSLRQPQVQSSLCSPLQALQLDDAVVRQLRRRRSVLYTMAAAPLETTATASAVPGGGGGGGGVWGGIMGSNSVGLGSLVTVARAAGSQRFISTSLREPVHLSTSPTASTIVGPNPFANQYGIGRASGIISSGTNNGAAVINCAGDPGGPGGGSVISGIGSGGGPAMQQVMFSLPDSEEDDGGGNGDVGGGGGDKTGNPR